MSTSITALNVLAKISGTQASSHDISTVSETILNTYSKDYTNGTAASMVNKVWSDTRTLAASTSEDLDLAGGLTDAFGNTVTFTAVKIIMVTAAAANTNNVIVGGAAATQFQGPFGNVNDTISVEPGGILLLGTVSAAGWTVGAGTADLLKILNGAAGTSVDYTILVGGEV